MSIDASGALSALDDIVRRADLASQAAVRKGAELVQHNIERRAPRLSGHLAGSVMIDGPKQTAAGWSVRVGPTAVYGRRIELGYHRRDRLGRSYHEGGHYYFRPAVNDALAVFGDMVTDEWGKAIGG